MNLVRMVSEFPLPIGSHGMLEHSTLWFGPWQPGLPAPERTTWQRDIRAEPGGALLGCQRMHATPEGRWWWPLGRIWKSEIFEGEDVSLLFVLERNVGLFTAWKLTEADDLAVGDVMPPSLLDSNGERRALLDYGTTAAGRVLDAESQVLADFAKEAEHLHVTLHPTLGDNPFLKMLVLAGILAIQPLPVEKGSG